MCYVTRYLITIINGQANAAYNPQKIIIPPKKTLHNNQIIDTILAEVVPLSEKGLTYESTLFSTNAPKVKSEKGISSKYQCLIVQNI